MVLNEEDVEGLPSGVRGAARNAAKEAGLGDDRYLFDIGKPSMLPFLSYSPRRDPRQELYTAYIEKCDHGDELDNKQLINEIIELRTRRANLLGYGTHAEYVLDANMAKTPENVYGLLDEIWTPALDGGPRGTCRDEGAEAQGKTAATISPRGTGGIMLRRYASRGITSTRRR